MADYGRKVYAVRQGFFSYGNYFNWMEALVAYHQAQEDFPEAGSFSVSVSGGRRATPRLLVTKIKHPIPEERFYVEVAQWASV